MKKEHLDACRFTPPSDTLSYFWGPVQAVHNEPLEQVGVIDRKHSGCAIIYQFHHHQIDLSCVPVVGEMSCDGELLTNFTIDCEGKFTFDKENKFIGINGKEYGLKLEGSLDKYYGILKLMTNYKFFDKDPKKIEVVCSYEWENR